MVFTQNSIETLAAVGVILAVAWRSDWKWEDRLLYLMGSAIFGVILLGQFGSSRLFGLTHTELGALTFLLGAGLCHLTFLSRKSRPLVHEGGVLLHALTFLYATTTLGRPWSWIWLAAFAPFALLLGASIWRRAALSATTRFALSLLYSGSFVLLGLRQVAFLDGIRALRGHGTNLFFFLGTVSLQASFYAIFHHAARFVNLLPIFATGNYRRYLRQEIIPTYAAAVAEDDVPRRQIILGALVHGTPIALNLVYTFVPEAVLIGYLLTISPWLVKTCMTATFPAEKDTGTISEPSPGAKEQKRSDRRRAI